MKTSGLERWDSRDIHTRDTQSRGYYTRWQSKRLTWHTREWKLRHTRWCEHLRDHGHTTGQDGWCRELAVWSDWSLGSSSVRFIRVIYDFSGGFLGFCKEII